MRIPRVLHGRDWGRTVVVYNDVFGVFVSDPVAFSVMWEYDSLHFEAAPFYDACVGR